MALNLSVLPSIEIGNCIAVQVCMLQIPILVLFTIFYVSSPRTPLGDLLQWGWGHVAPHEVGQCMCPQCMLSACTVQGKRGEMPPTLADAVPSPRDTRSRGLKG